MTLRAFSFGGGVQSTAALVLAVQGKLDYQTFLFANVGEDSENPATLRYVAEHAKPYAAAHGLALIELEKRGLHGARAGERKTVYGELTREGSRSIAIPVRMANGAPGTRRCTSEFKIKVIGRWLRAHGATAAAPAALGVGFSTDEIERAGPTLDKRDPYVVKEYPLLHPLRLSRNDCLNVIAAAGLPQPPKSSCWFCPFHAPIEWMRMKREEPDQFERSCALEELVNERRKRIGKDAVYFTRFGRPLRDVFAGGTQLSLLDVEGACDSGYCWR